MKRSTARFAGVAFAVLVAAGPSAAQNSEQDALALKRLSGDLAQPSGAGNLKPAFASLILARKDAKGVYETPVEQVVLQNDERHSVARNVIYDIPTGAPDHADYGLYFDGWRGALSWSGGDNFLTIRGSKFTLNDDARKTSLYVADVTDTYPGFEWLEGPFSVIRQQGHDDVYAIWSSRLNWLVYSPDWQVEGATLDGKVLGLGRQPLIEAVRKKDWTTQLAKLDAARSNFAAARADQEKATRQVYRGTPVDVLPQYKASGADQAGHGINDPEAKIASSLAAFIPDGSTAVSSVNVRVASPAWWTVSKGNRKVYILGVPWLFKDGVEWNQFRLSNRLRDVGGKFVLPPLLANDAPPENSAADIAPNANKTPDDYRTRIQKAAAVIGQPAGRYLAVSPLVAGYRLSTDFRAKLGLQPELATVEVSKAALHMNFSPRHVDMIHWPVSDRSSVPGPEAGLACLDAALEEVDSGPAAFNQAMEAWAKGDVRTALTAPRGLEKCSFAFPVESQIRQDSIKLQVDTIRSALAPGAGSGVVVVYLRALLSEDGVLAQLQHQGYTIAAPIND
jgi:hypothetical protein